jgi:hypothetical protein
MPRRMIGLIPGTSSPSGSGITTSSGVLFAAAGVSDVVVASAATVNFATSYTLPANYLTANRVLRVTFGFDLITGAVAPTMGLNLKMGATNVAILGTGQTPAANLGNSIVGISFIIQGSAAASASAAVYVHPMVPSSSSGSAWTIFINNPSGPAGAGGASTNLATNGALAIVAALTANGAGTGTNSLTLNQMVVEALN